MPQKGWFPPSEIGISSSRHLAFQYQPLEFHYPKLGFFQNHMVISPRKVWLFFMVFMACNKQNIVGFGLSNTHWGCGWYNHQDWSSYHNITAMSLYMMVTIKGTNHVYMTFFQVGEFIATTTQYKGNLVNLISCIPVQPDYIVDGENGNGVWGILSFIDNLH